MALSGLLDLLADEPTLADAESRALRGPHPLTVEVRDGAKSAVLGLLGRRASQPLLVVTAEDGRAAELAHDIRMWCNSRPVLHFPDPDQPAYSMLAILPDGSIGCLYERGKSIPYETITFARFTMDWLAGGG